MSKKQELEEIPIVRGTPSPEQGTVQRVLGAHEVKFYLLDIVTPSGQRETVLVKAAGDQVVLMENKGREAPMWMKKGLLERLKKAHVEQA